LGEDVVRNDAHLQEGAVCERALDVSELLGSKCRLVTLACQAALEVYIMIQSE